MTRTADGLIVLGPDEGDTFPSMDAVRKSSAADGDGGWGVVIVRGVPGEGGRTHTHRGQAEGFYILEGVVEFLGAESMTPMTAGAFALVPPDTEHGIRIVGRGPAAWLAIWPSALDGFPDELERLRASNVPDEEIDLLRQRHGVAPGRSR